MKYILKLFMNTAILRAGEIYDQKTVPYKYIVGSILITSDFVAIIWSRQSRITNHSTTAML